MKFTLKNLSLRHYLRHVRRQNSHIQHVHAFAFAGIITALIAAFILYTDYGFWHERYQANDGLVVVDDPNTMSFDSAAPASSFGNFWAEAKARFTSIGSSSANLLEGKETYTK